MDHLHPRIAGPECRADPFEEVRLAQAHPPLDHQGVERPGQRVDQLNRGRVRQPVAGPGHEVVEPPGRPGRRRWSRRRGRGLDLRPRPVDGRLGDRDGRGGLLGRSLASGGGPSTTWPSGGGASPSTRKARRSDRPVTSWAASTRFLAKCPWIQSRKKALGTATSSESESSATPRRTPSPNQRPNRDSPSRLGFGLLCVFIRLHPGLYRRHRSQSPHFGERKVRPRRLVDCSRAARVDRGGSAWGPSRGWAKGETDSPAEEICPSIPPLSNAKPAPSEDLGRSQRATGRRLPAGAIATAGGPPSHQCPLKPPRPRDTMARATRPRKGADRWPSPRPPGPRTATIRGTSSPCATWTERPIASSATSGPTAPRPDGLPRRDADPDVSRIHPRRRCRVVGAPDPRGSPSAPVRKIKGTRTTTLRRGTARRKGAGKEPDNAFYIGENERRMRKNKTLDLTVDPPPDVAIEVDNTRNSKRALAIYARVGVPEASPLRRPGPACSGSAGSSATIGWSVDRSLDPAKADHRLGPPGPRRLRRGGDGRERLVRMAQGMGPSAPRTDLKGAHPMATLDTQRPDRRGRLPSRAPSSTGSPGRPTSNSATTRAIITHGCPTSTGR